MLQAEATDGEAFAALLPSLSADFGATRSGSNKNALPPFDALGLGGTIRPTPINTVATTGNSFSAGFSASYELDFWGENQDKLRQARKACAPPAMPTVPAPHPSPPTWPTNISPCCPIASAATIARQNIDAANRILTVTEAKVTNGVASNLDLSEEQATVATQQARLPALIDPNAKRAPRWRSFWAARRKALTLQAVNLDRHLGPPPLSSPAFPPEPCWVLSRYRGSRGRQPPRMPVRRGPAPAFFPATGLTGPQRYLQFSFRINPANFAWTIGASVVQTIFDGGLEKGAEHLALAQQPRQQLAAYRHGGVQRLLRCRKPSLAKARLNRPAGGADRSCARRQRSLPRTFELPFEGTIDIPALLQNQQNLFTAEDTLVQTQAGAAGSWRGPSRLGRRPWTQQAADNIPHQPDCMSAALCRR